MTVLENKLIVTERNIYGCKLYKNMEVNYQCDFYLKKTHYNIQLN